MGALLKAAERFAKAAGEVDGALAGLSPALRERRVLALLEAAALGVPVSREALTAARTWLEHKRWTVEMRKGRPRQQLDVGLGALVRVVNAVQADSKAITAHVVDPPHDSAQLTDGTLSDAGSKP